MLKILFVCSGNTCRSPMAEMMLKSKLKDKKIEAEVSSAGIFANDGDAMSLFTEEALKEKNIPIDEFKSRKINDKIIKNCDYIFCMTKRQKEFLPAENVYVLGEFTKESDVSDPFGGDKETYLAVFNQLNTMCDKICELLNW